MRIGCKLQYKQVALERDKTINIRLSIEELDKARLLAEDMGISMSDWVRLSIRSSFEERFRAPKPKPKQRSA